MTQNYIERYWRDATPEDAIKDPPMVARFRNEDAEDWEYDLLVGWDRTDQCHWRSELDSFEQCQVYDAPDPGEGWRLIDVENETEQEGDEYLSFHEVWKPAQSNKFFSNLAYRRRITPTVTYVPFTWEDRDQLRGRWITRDNQELQLVNLDNSDGFFANGVHVVNLCLYWKFIDTGKPVGKQVVQ